MRVLVTENIAGAGLDALAAKHDVSVQPDLWQDPDALAAALAEAVAVLVRNQTKLTQALIAGAPHLKVIGRAGAGLDNIDVAAAKHAGIPVVFTPAENSISVAELALGLMLSLARMIPAADADTRGGGWDRKGFTGTELYGKTLGLVGLGRIGRLVAERANALGMTVIGADPVVAPDDPDIVRLKVRVVPFETLLAEADFVSCHAPLNDATRGMFGAEAFAAMRPHARFLNTSRGELVQEDALLAALRDGQIAGAALDVREAEPPALGELESLSNVLLMPHIGAFTEEAQDRVVDVVCADIAAVLAGQEPKFPAG